MLLDFGRDSEMERVAGKGRHSPVIECMLPYKMGSAQRGYCEASYFLGRVCMYDRTCTCASAAFRALARDAWRINVVAASYASHAVPMKLECSQHQKMRATSKTLRVARNGPTH